MEDKPKKVGIRLVEPSFELVTARYNENWASQGQRLAEECGRVSHKSLDKITETSAGKFLKRVAIRRGHESILEHVHVTARFIGSRTMSHQLVRHRISAITQESMRYCDYSSVRFAGDPEETDGDTKLLNVICPPSILPFNQQPAAVVAQGRGDALFFQMIDMVGGAPRPCGLESFLGTTFWPYARSAVRGYLLYLKLRELGVPAEDARFALSNGAKTEVYITLNLRTWRHFFLMRDDKHAQWEIRGLAHEGLLAFKEAMPAIFEDVEPNDKMVRLSEKQRNILRHMLKDESIGPAPLPEVERIEAEIAEMLKRIGSK